MDASLKVSEIYLSVQGESTWAGLPCVFVRLTGCPLRCTYCDSAYAFYGGERVSIAGVLDKVRELAAATEGGEQAIVEVTGGEPLAQPNCIQLLEALLRDGYIVLLETSGAISIKNVPREVRKILDVKCPSSGEQARNEMWNMELLAPHDEVKFVIGTREDYEFAREVVRQNRLCGRVAAVLFSCVFGSLEPATLSEWILADRLLGVRLQLQMHKYIWPAEARGV